MKVIFLDIDGVLVSARSCLAFGGLPDTAKGYERDMFDEVAVSLIRKIAAKAEAKIVLSSSWRSRVDFASLGEDLNLPIIDQTPVLHGQPRGQEIHEWLVAHTDVEDYAIVDDREDFLMYQKKHLVRPMFADGFSKKNAEWLSDILSVSIHDADCKAGE